jgi:hypothetical protein
MISEPLVATMMLLLAARTEVAAAVTMVAPEMALLSPG